MHEATLAANLLRAARGALAGREGARVREVRARVGALAGVMPEALRFAFDALKRGTPLKGAELVLCEAPARLSCLDCGTEYEPQSFPWTCPACASARFLVAGGEEILLESLEMDV